MTHIIQSANACHQRIDATIPPPCRHNDSDAVRLQNDATHSPHKQSKAVVGESGETNRVHYVTRTIDEHGRAVDCNKIRIDGFFSRQELAALLCLMPEDREDFGQ